MNLIVKIKETTFNNPIWVASGTFGSGEEFKDLVNLDTVGAVVTKTVTLKEREGNPPPRVVETPSGMLNSIGLENKGLEYFLKETYPPLAGRSTKKIVSIAGSRREEFVKCAERLSSEDTVDAIEVNLSCPNVSHGKTKYRLLAQDPQATEAIIKDIKKCTKKIVMAKLTPNVTDLTEIARSAEAGGADAVTLVNTYFGMAIDADGMKPLLGNVLGGLSGPAIKPMALKAVWDVYNSVRIPVIGIGGIMTGRDVAEFMLAGASAVQTGTANLVDPASYGRILKEFEEYLEKQGIKKAASLTGKLKIK